MRGNQEVEKPDIVLALICGFYLWGMIQEYSYKRIADGSGHAGAIRRQHHNHNHNTPFFNWGAGHYTGQPSIFLRSYIRSSSQIAHFHSTPYQPKWPMPLDRIAFGKDLAVTSLQIACYSTLIAWFRNALNISWLFRARFHLQSAKKLHSTHKNS